MSKTKTTTANVLSASAISAVRYGCITKPSVCKVNSGFNDVPAGPLVFDI